MSGGDRVIKRIPVLLYHSVSDFPASDEIAPYTVSPAAFERHLELVAERHQALTVSQLVECLGARRPLPPSPVVITFDDGFADNLANAAPLLAAHKLPATVYVTTGYVGHRGMLGWEQLGELEAAGIEVGAHAHTHTPLDELRATDAVLEIRRSKAMIEQRLQHQVASFAYPHGYSTRRLRNEVREAGFGSACGVRNAFSHPADDPWCIARLTVLAGTGPERIERWLRAEGAPVASPREALRTAAWRAVRRVRHSAVPRLRHR